MLLWNQRITVVLQWFLEGVFRNWVQLLANTSWTILQAVVYQKVPRAQSSKLGHLVCTIVIKPDSTDSSINFRKTSCSGCLAPKPARSSSTNIRPEISWPWLSFNLIEAGEFPHENLTIAELFKTADDFPAYQVVGFWTTRKQLSHHELPHQSWRPRTGGTYLRITFAEMRVDETKAVQLLHMWCMLMSARVQVGTFF